MKRLEDAIRNGDPVRAVIRETALNQDGKTATVTSPDGAAQLELIRECYERAGLDPRHTIAVEAHGTGTPAGDPIEANAIGRAFTPEGGRPRDSPVFIASVKTNLGHTEAVSGLAALIKMAKSIEHGQIAPSLNFEKANKNIDLHELGLEVSWGAGPTTQAHQADMIVCKRYRLWHRHGQQVIVDERQSTISATAVRMPMSLSRKHRKQEIFSKMELR